ncbi:MAG: hydroxymethylbilane synthase, partial [Deltaproteobacteria bacterium]|nr:hydroxymethylbilane synthase [Deltaproteobacteria bacterium]
TAHAVKAERALLKRLEGGCQVPIAAYGVTEGDKLTLSGLVASVDGSRVIKSGVEGGIGSAEELGVTLAESLLRDGALEILKELYDVAPPDSEK